MMRHIVLFWFLTFGFLPFGLTQEKTAGDQTPLSHGTSLILLGTLQDGGSPHIGCTKSCCADLFDAPPDDRQVICLGLYDHANNRRYMFEATPDLPRQMKAFKHYGHSNNKEMADGIFLTHAHIGHYTGLMFLGKEATDAQEVPVYAMPRMADFLTSHGPWSQLVGRKNIQLNILENNTTVVLSDEIRVTPFTVPHRDEYSETVGYRIEGPNKKALFIPDIDKWEKWDRNIIEEIKQVDYAFLDATFFSGEEINQRDITQIPHPFIIESIKKFESLPDAEKNKIIFIHFNHTNPVIDAESKEAKYVTNKGFRLGHFHQTFML